MESSAQSAEPADSDGKVVAEAAWPKVHTVQVDHPSAGFTADLAGLDLNSISPSIERLVQQHVTTVRASIGDVWPPVKNMSAEEGCARMITMLEQSAVDLVTEVVGPLSVSQLQCVKTVVFSVAQKCLKDWKESVVTPGGASSAFSLAAISKRGMVQPRKKKKKR